MESSVHDVILADFINKKFKNIINAAAAHKANNLSKFNDCYGTIL